jgi:hypothetical protein
VAALSAAEGYQYPGDGEKHGVAYVWQHVGNKPALSAAKKMAKKQRKRHAKESRKQ